MQPCTSHGDSGAAQPLPKKSISDKRSLIYADCEMLTVVPLHVDCPSFPINAHQIGPHSVPMLTIKWLFRE